MDQSACWFVIFFWATKMWGNVDERQLEIRAASFLDSLKYFLENMRILIMEKVIFFVGYNKESFAVSGASDTDRSIIQGNGYHRPMNIILENPEERQRFEQSVDLVYDPNTRHYTLGGRNPKIKFYGCQYQKTSSTGAYVFTAERFEWLEEVH